MSKSGNENATLAVKDNSAEFDKSKKQENSKPTTKELIIICIIGAVIVAGFFSGLILFDSWWRSSTLNNWINNWEFVPGCVDDKIACVPIPILFYDKGEKFSREYNDPTHCCISVCEKAYIHDEISNWVKACDDTGYYHYRFNRTRYEHTPPVFSSVYPNNHEDL